MVCAEFNTVVPLEFLLTACNEDKMINIAYNGNKNELDCTAK